MIKHSSDSSEQQLAEKYILASLQSLIRCKFEQNTRLPIDLDLKPDAVDLLNKIVVEVYARVGKVKGSQLNKIKGDILKLALIDKRLGPGWRKIMCFASNKAAQYLRGKSWVTEAVKEFGVEVIAIELPKEQKEKILSAQKRQQMINPT